jgi:hypothetical protein
MAAGRNGGFIPLPWHPFASCNDSGPHECSVSIEESGQEIYDGVSENNAKMPQWSSGMIPALGFSKLQEVPDSISG